MVQNFAGKRSMETSAWLARHLGEYAGLVKGGVGYQIE
jgi:hypothetical protein